MKPIDWKEVRGTVVIPKKDIGPAEGSILDLCRQKELRALRSLNDYFLAILRGLDG